jgi:zinc transport system ATP-binding protein
MKITCNHLTLGYDTPLVEDLNFTLQKGDFLCIVGENGSGKSTLMKTLLGLMPPLGGSIEGLNTQGAGYLPQQTEAQMDFPASVEEVVRSGCRSHFPFYSKKEKARAAETMADLRITDLKKECYRELSGGQQQRVLLARALCAAEDLLLLDEPVTGLDPSATADFYRLICRINRERGLTVMMITHDIQTAIEHATHVLDLGQEIFFGTKHDYLHNALSDRFCIHKGGEHKCC